MEEAKHQNNKKTRRKQNIEIEIVENSPSKSKSVTPEFVIEILPRKKPHKKLKPNKKLKHKKHTTNIIIQKKKLKTFYKVKMHLKMILIKVT